jgi:hypothetical protein
MTVEGGLDGPLRASPQDSIAAAKPPLEAGRHQSADE